MVESTDPGWIQLEFDTLTGIFDRVGLRTNVRKTVGMVCRLCRAARVRSDEAYTWIMTGKERIFKERKREWVLYPKCRKYMENGSLVTHRQTQHGVVKGGLGPEVDEVAGSDNPRT